MNWVEEYSLSYNEYDEYRVVSKEEFVRAERQAGFRNTMGQPNEPATGGFSSGSVHGRVRYIEKEN